MQDGRRSVEVSTNTKTITDAESGLIQNVTASGTVTLTLPAAAAGKVVTIRAAGARPGGKGPVGAGTGKSQNIVVTGSVTGLGATGALSLSTANQVAGAEITLVSGASTWYTATTRGNWAVA